MSSKLDDFIAHPSPMLVLRELAQIAENLFHGDDEKRWQFFWALKMSLVYALEDNLETLRHYGTNSEIRKSAKALFTCLSVWKATHMETVRSEVEPPSEPILVPLINNIFGQHNAILNEAIRLAKEYALAGAYDELARTITRHTFSSLGLVHGRTQRHFRRAALDTFEKNDDYEPDKSVKLEGGYQLLKIKKKRSLYHTVGYIMQNCLRPSSKSDQVSRYLPPESNSSEYLLCDAQGKMHVMLSVKNGVLVECRGKQNDYPRKYYPYVIKICEIKGWAYSREHHKTGLLKHRGKIHDITRLPIHYIGNLFIQEAKSLVEFPDPLRVGEFKVLDSPGLVRLPALRARTSVAILNCPNLAKWESPFKTPLLVLSALPKVWPENADIGIVYYRETRMRPEDFLKVRREALGL
jgi:hypothetical protein